MNPPTASAAGRVSTGIAGLDDVLAGGLSSNHIYLVAGDPGVGKTTLALQFVLEGMRQGEPGLYVTHSETGEELRAVAQAHGWSLDGLAIHELIPSDEALKTEGQYTLFHPSEVELEETTKTVLDEAERVKPVRVVFDSVAEMRLLAQNPLRYRRQILALKQFFVGRQCTVLLLGDRASTPDDLQVQSLVHGVIELEHLAPEYGAERRRLRVLKLRGGRFRGGYHDFTIETGGLSVYPRLIAAEHRPGFSHEAVPSGLKELDALLGGGLERGISALIMGPAGVGKSSLAVSFATAAAGRGEHATVYLFDETVETYLIRAAGLGMDVRGHVDAGRMSVRQVDPGELSPGQFVHMVRQSVERDQSRVVVIDSLNGYLQAMPDEHFLVVQMHELLTYHAQKAVVTLVVVGQQGLLGSAMPLPVDLSYLADTALLLRYFEDRGRVRRALSVLKKRTGSHEDTIRELRLGPGGIRIGKPLAEFQGILTGVPVYEGQVPRLAEEEHDKE